MKYLFILAMVAAICGASTVVLADQMASGPYHIMVTLNAQNGSGETGVATLAQDNQDVLVFVSLVGGAATQPMHIHTGTCANLTPAPKYPLSPITNGSSSTRLKGMQLDSLLASPFAINVHKSPNDVKTYVSCGNITK